MVTPQVPGSGPVRQTVLRHQTHGQADDPVRVVAARRCQVRQVGVEEEATEAAGVFGVNHAQLTRPVTAWAADIQQGAVAQAVAWARPSATRASASGIVPRAALAQGGRQVLHPGDALSRVREVFARFHARPSKAVMPGKPSEPMGKGQGKINFLAQKPFFVSYGLALRYEMRLTVHTG